LNRVEPTTTSNSSPQFLRIHRNHAVNLARIREIRRRKGRDDWEVKLEPPVNRVLPVSRGRLETLLNAFRPGQ